MMQNAEPDQIAIRVMNIDDLDEVYEIDCLSFPTAWSKESYIRDMRNPHCCYMVAVSRNSIVGYAGMWVVYEDAHITTLAVKPECRRQGIGRKLFEALMTEAAKRGAQKMSLEVRHNNNIAQRLYESYGFVPLARIKKYYLDTGDDAIVMACNLLPGAEKGAFEDAAKQ